MSVYRQRHRGFTLLEVLVALAILAFAMSALVKGGAESTVASAHLRDKTYGQWVAMNKVAEMQLAEGWAAIGESKGHEEMLGHNWTWKAKVSETFDEDVHRVDVEVFAGEDANDSPVVIVSGFLARPLGVQQEQSR